MNLRFSTLPEVADRLAAKSWAVEVSKGQHFITSDQPLSLWLKRPSAVRGVGVEGADEIRFPASPHHLVVLRPRGKDSTYVVPRVRVASVNQHAAATCRQLIIAEGSQTSVLQQLTLRAHRPMLKMNEAPGYREGPNGLESVGDIMHFFNPYDDRDPRDYPSELPTDAVVEERCRLPRELRRVSAGSGPRRPRMVDRSGEIFRAPHEAIDPSSTRRGQKMDHPLIGTWKASSCRCKPSGRGRVPVCHGVILAGTSSRASRRRDKPCFRAQPMAPPDERGRGAGRSRS